MSEMNAPRYFELQADDPARAAAFYRAVFGWEIVRAEAMPIEYWRIGTGAGTRSGSSRSIRKRAEQTAR